MCSADFSVVAHGGRVVRLNNVQKMENELKQRNQRNRRRERAQRMQAQRESKLKDGDSGEDESPDREKPPRPQARRKKSKEPLGEEDIIDGFAIMAFRTYEDLEAAVKCASSPRTNSLSTKPARLPFALLPGDAARNLPTNNVNHGITLLQDAGTSDDSGRASERLTGSSVAPRDPDSSRDRLSDASSRCSSGKGYICDSEGDDDKASPDDSRNASPKYQDTSMEDAPEAGALFRVANTAAGAASKNELVARGGSGGAVAISRAPVGGSASPAPAPLPHPAPSPAPAALPPPAIPPPHFRADLPHRAAAHIPALDGQAATPLPVRPADTAERPAGNKLQPGARTTADSPTPAPPAPSPLFPAHPAHAALPDYRHTNHETRTTPQASPQPALPPASAAPSAPLAATLPSQPAAAPTHLSRPYPVPAIGSSHNAPALPPAVPNHALYSTPSSLQRHPAPAPYGRPSHLAPFSVAGHLATPPATPHHNHSTNGSLGPGVPHHVTPTSQHAALPSLPVHSLTTVATSTPNIVTPSYVPSLKHQGLPTHAFPPTSHSLSLNSAESIPSSIIAPPATSATAPLSVNSQSNIDTRQPPITTTDSLSAPSSLNGYPSTPYATPSYPPLYAPYANNLQQHPYLPPTAASPRNLETRTSLSSSPLLSQKTAKGLRPQTPSSTSHHGLHPYSPRVHSPNRERDIYSGSINSLSRPIVSTPVSATAAPVPTIGPIPSIAPLPTSLPPPAPVSMAPSITTPLAVPLAMSSSSVVPSLAPVPTVPSISSCAKPPAHWGVTRPSVTDRAAGFPPAPPLFSAPLAPHPNPNPFSAESLFQTSPGADLLRRELDSRFLAAAAVGSSPLSLRTEMHHHQHQHTHVHQHPPFAPPHPHPQPTHPHPHAHTSLFKDVGKMPSLYRSGLGLGYPYSSGLLHPTAPYVPQSPITSYAPKPVVPAVSDPATKAPRPVAKTGKWNAMHVRIAWEIYNHQQKEKAGGNASATEKDKLRSFPTPAPPPPPAPPPAPFRSPYDLPPPYLTAHHPHLGLSPFSRYGASGFPGPPPPFGLSPYPGALAAPLHGVHHPSSLALHDAWRSGVRPNGPTLTSAREHEERQRREREERERERREREERERRRREGDRARARSPLRNGEVKEERKFAPSWEPYRFDPLHHMRFTPLVEAAIRAEEDRAKMLSAYAHHHHLKSNALLHRGLAPLQPLQPLPPLHAPMQPLDLLKKEEPRS